MTEPLIFKWRKLEGQPQTSTASEFWEAQVVEARLRAAMLGEMPFAERLTPEQAAFLNRYPGEAA